MWDDNEADLDLLGFDFLVDSLVVALTEPRLLPVTIGVLGEWGSGKSSLMRLAAAELEKITSADPDGEDPVSRYLTVHFSPWHYEDHDDVKIALMTAVLDAIAERMPSAAEEIGRLRTIVANLRRWGRRLGRAGATAAPMVVPLVLQATVPDLDPQVAELATTATGAVATRAQAALADTDDPAPVSPVPAGGVDAFRREFNDLVGRISDCDAVVVFIDDLDRCLPETVVDTFEAIRLFLNTPKTAYVLALNQNVVESAIDSRYPDLRKDDGAGIGRDYLEKMLQLKVAIPPLSDPEAETYANLLFAELRLESVDFDKVLAKATQVRRERGLAVAFNIGIAGEVLDNIPAQLSEDLTWAADISPVLNSSLRGNPRQFKRFLNNLLLKQRSAKRRDIDLQLPVLAKLMVLEDQHHTDFQKLFDWEMAAGGSCLEIGDAEDHARAVDDDPGVADESTATAGRTEPPASGDDATNGFRSEAREWAEKRHIGDWLRVDPPLKGINLLPYFTYSRDRLSFGVSASRLPTHLQRLLTDIQSDIVGNRRRHRDTVAELTPTERAQFVEALLDRVRRTPDSTAFTAALEIAEHSPDTLDTVCAALQRIPVSAIPRRHGAAAVQRLPRNNEAVADLLNRWEDGENSGLAKVVKTTRSADRRPLQQGAPSGNLG